MSVYGNLTDLYRFRLTLLRDGTVGVIDNLWNTVFRIDAAGETLPAIGSAASALITRAQAGAVNETMGWLRSLLADAGHDPSGLTIPDSRIGSLPSGRPLAQLADSAASAFNARLGRGLTPEDAAEQVHNYLTRVAADTPYWSANMTARDVIGVDPRFYRRYRRMLSPDACEWCRMTADRGYTEANVAFSAHAHCKCTIGPEIRPATSRWSINYGSRVYGGG